MQIRMRAPLYSMAFSGVLCFAMLAGLARADMMDPLSTTATTEITSQGMRSVTGDIYSQGMMVESGCGAVAVGRACLLPPLSSGGALVARPWLRFHIPLIEPDMRISLHPALGQDLTPSSTARRAQAGSDARARGSRRGAGVDSCRPCIVWSCA